MIEDDSSYEASGSETLESRPIGEYLRRQRILRGMSAEELAEQTRIPLRSLERLESGHFDGETDGFVRGFVRTVALALGLDSDDTISRMLQEPQGSAWERHGPGRSVKQAFAIIVFLFLVGFVALGLRAAWGLLLGDASQPASRQVVIWRDPVHSLAIAAGAEVDPTEEIDPRVGATDQLRPRAMPEPRGAHRDESAWRSPVPDAPPPQEPAPGRDPGDELVLAP